MAVLSQGTQIYMLVNSESDPLEKRIVRIECATTFQPGEDSTDQIDTTCLEAEARSFLDGLRTAGQGSIGLNADPRNASHILLDKLAKGRTSDKKDAFKWAVGWSDGKNIPPTLNGNKDGWVLPTTRTWIEFEATVSTFPFDFQGNTVVASNVTISRSGDSSWTPKVGGAATLPANYTVTVTDPLAFYLRVGSKVTAGISPTALPAAVKSAIEAAATGTTATVTGTAPNYTVVLAGHTGELSGFGATVAIV